MKQPIYPILPGFPDTESFKELSFHLKELHWDLTSLVKQVEALSANVPDTPQALLSIQYGLVDVTSGIEHDVLKAAQEDYWQLLATPLQEEYHPSARSLDSCIPCIRCGAKLTADDRTFDGSYCESCRTRWIQS
jgi:hypothetical protein